MKTELILATYDQGFNALLGTSGKDVILSRITGDFTSVYNPEMLMMGSRLTLDKNPLYTHIRQLIPYVVVRAGTDIAVYSRTSKSTETRLHDMLSIGFGGHIDLDDIISVNSHVDVRQTIINSCYRELHEELAIDADNVVNTPGSSQHFHIVSKEDAVGTVHLGLLFIVDVIDRSQLQIEPELNFVGWYPEEYIRSHLGDEFKGLEGWSMAVINNTATLSEIPALPYPGE